MPTRFQLHVPQEPQRNDSSLAPRSQQTISLAHYQVPSERRDPRLTLAPGGAAALAAEVAEATTGAEASSVCGFCGCREELKAWRKRSGSLTRTQSCCIQLHTALTYALHFRRGRLLSKTPRT